MKTKLKIWKELRLVATLYHVLARYVCLVSLGPSLAFVIIIKANKTCFCHMISYFQFIVLSFLKSSFLLSIRSIKFYPSDLKVMYSFLLFFFKTWLFLRFISFFFLFIFFIDFLRSSITLSKSNNASILACLIYLE